MERWQRQPSWEGHRVIQVLPSLGRSLTIQAIVPVMTPVTKTTENNTMVRGVLRSNVELTKSPLSAMAGFQDCFYLVNVLKEDRASGIIKAGAGDVNLHLSDDPSRPRRHDQDPVSHKHRFLNHMGD